MSWGLAEEIQEKRNVDQSLLSFLEYLQLKGVTLVDSICMRMKSYCSSAPELQEVCYISLPN